MEAVEMAENETLDLRDRHSGRWRQLLRKIERGESLENISEEAVRCVYKTIQNLIDLFSKQGLPLGKLLDAAERNDGSLHEMVRRCRKGRDYAELLEQLATIHHERGVLIRVMLSETLERFLDQMRHELLGRTHWPDTARLTSNVPESVGIDLDRLAERLAVTPDVKPRMPGRSVEQKNRDHADLMRTSVLSHAGTH